MIKIKKIEKEDLDQPQWSKDLFLLYQEFFAEQNSFSHKYEFNYKEKEFIELMKDELTRKENVIFVSFVEEVKISFLRGYIKKDLKTFILHDFYICKNHRKQGYGQKQFQYLVNFLKSQNLEKIELLVDVNNQAGLNFWKKSGLKPWQIKMDMVL